MSHTYIDELIVNTMVVDQQQPISDEEKQHLDKFRQEMTNAVQNGLEPELCLNITMLLCTLVKKGLSPNAVHDKIDDILSFMKMYPLKLTDDYIDELIQYII